MTHKIFDGNDKAMEDHGLDQRATFTTHRGRTLFDWNTLITPVLRPHGIPVWNGIEGSDMPLKAYIEAGRWLARCECGGVEYVASDDPIFFCHECGNKVVGGKSRPVIFPKDIKKIETELMKREVSILPGDELYPPIHQSRSSIPVGLPRNWHPEDGK